MNLDELRSVQSRERQADSLQHLSETFYRDAAEFVAGLRAERERAAERADDPFSSPEVQRLTDDIETAEGTVEAIYERRVGKVVKLASIAAADMPADDEGLTAEERDLFETLVSAIEDNRERVLSVLDGEAPAGRGGGGDGSGETPGDRPAASDGPTASDRSAADASDGPAREHADATAAERDDRATDAGGGAATDDVRPRERDDDGESRPPAADGTPGGAPDEPPAPPDEPVDAPTAAAEVREPESVDAADLMGTGGGTGDAQSGSGPGAESTSGGPGAEQAADGRDDGNGRPAGAAGQRGDGGTVGTTDAGAGDTDAGARAADEVPRATVRITTDVGEIYGVDERAYHLSDEDVVTLPEANATPLVERDAAERLD